MKLPYKAILNWYSELFLFGRRNFAAELIQIYGPALRVL